MAEGLSRIATTSVEYHESPVTEPPSTRFPHPKNENSNVQDSAGERLGSEQTLTPGAGDGLTTPLTSRDANRPELARLKYETEISKPVGNKSIYNIERSETTPNRPRASTAPVRPSIDYLLNYDSASSDDDDEEEDARPDSQQLGAKQLNRTRMRPRYERKRTSFEFGDENLQGRGRIAKDGRLNVRINPSANTGYLAKALGNALQSHLNPDKKRAKQQDEDVEEHYSRTQETSMPPRMNIVIMVIGSRGDIQPFLKIAQILRDTYGHRVRIATHPTFRTFVQDEIGLEFFSIGGDPSELMSFMVRNPGLIPSFETLTSGEVGRRREQMYEMFNGFWRACVNTTDDEKDTANLKMMGNKSPFVADAIIANPVSFAHYHCAERLGIPLQLVFTFPYTPTTAFPHPLANIKSSSEDREYTNYMSYPLVDLMTWQGLGDLVNRFRVKTLGLEPVSTLWAPGQLTRLRVPITYLWSPGLVPKPEDWGPEVDVAGYVFLDLAKSYKPSKELTEFLKRTDDDKRPIIYIGFGSIAGIKDARAFCQLIFDATVDAGVKAVVSRGWGGMGDNMDIPDGVFMVDNVPHDWLFPQLDAVVHHGGAGTTAIGLKLGLPTMIVPFFGDQPFWANMIARARAGARQVYPLKKLNVERFATGIEQCLEPESKENAQAIAKSIALDGDGAENAVDAFHRGLTLGGKHSQRCGIFKDRIAVWQVHHTGLRLSALAADLLVENKQLNWNDLELIRHKKWVDFSGPGEPITGVGGTVVSAFQEAFHGMSSIHEHTKADLKRIERRRRKKKGMTVADAVVLPGKTAQKVRQMQTDESATDAMIPVNLTGDAEPLRMSVAGSANQGKKRPAANRTETTSSIAGPAPIIIAKDVGKGFGHSMKAFVLLPMDMLNAITLGFRNAPRLYGDRTVRPPPSAVRGLRQGLRVAVQELAHGFYDGATGLVRIPYLDVQQGGMRGLPKGLAKGAGGVVLKPIAGSLGLLNYTNKGLYASLKRRIRDTEKTDRWIRQARLAQGVNEVKELREKDQKQRVDRGEVPAPNNDGPELTRARSQALTRFSTREQPQVQQNQAQEPPKSPRLSRADRALTA